MKKENNDVRIGREENVSEELVHENLDNVAIIEDHYEDLIQGAIEGTQTDDSVEIGDNEDETEGKRKNLDAESPNQQPSAEETRSHYYEEVYNFKHIVKYKHKSKLNLRTRISTYIPPQGGDPIPFFLRYNDKKGMIEVQEIKDYKIMREILISKKKIRIGSSGFYEIQGEEKTIDIASGLGVIFGLSGSGKTTLAISLAMLDERIKYLNFGEPDELSILDAFELIDHVNKYLADEDTDIIIIDSVRNFVYSDSGAGSTMPGGIAASVFNMMARMSALLAWLDKTILFVFNPLAGENDTNLIDKVTQACIGSVSCFIVADRGRYEIQNRLNMDRRKRTTFSVDDLIEYNGYNQSQLSEISSEMSAELFETINTQEKQIISKYVQDANNKVTEILRKGLR